MAIMPPSSPSERTNRQTSVYRFYDALGVLIYVGITARGVNRQLEHNLAAEWWPYVTRQEVEHFASRPDASRREAELIRYHRPPFNKQLNPDHEMAKALYLQLVEKQSQSSETAFEMFSRLGGWVPLQLRDRPSTDGRCTFYSPLEYAPLCRELTVDPSVVRFSRLRNISVESCGVVGCVLVLQLRGAALYRATGARGKIKCSRTMDGFWLAVVDFDAPRRVPMATSSRCA